MALEKMLEHKRIEVVDRMKRRPLASFEREIEPSDRSLEAALKKQKTGFIMECKKASPSKGLIREDFDVKEIASTYARFADAVSVLTDNRFFFGNLEYLKAVRDTVYQPVLCKDIVVDSYQVYEARYFGADAVLLMLSVLDNLALRECMSAAGSLDLDVLAEVHDEQELERALNFDLPIIGVNNRNLKTLEVDMSVTDDLAPKVPPDRIVVSESGILTHADTVRFRPNANAFLVGTSLMSKKDIARACRNLIFGPVKVCGLTRPEDARDALSAGATYGGLIFADESLRKVDLAQAMSISKAADLDWVGVFVNERPKRVAELAQKLKLRAVQLHGNETRDYLSDLKKLAPPGLEVWRAVSVKGSIPDLETFGADRIVLDAYKPGARGGTGERFDWSLLEGRDLSKIVLGGGLNPKNAAEADTLGCFALDVNSGVETKPGVKDNELLRLFFDALRGTGRSGD
jgi:indole-3-glycerol phosphate synthase/phosphoribosylanthranilate isomerase